MKIGIDSHGINSGGGFSHLYELLRQFAHDAEKYPSISFIVWGDHDTLQRLPNGPKIKKIYSKKNKKNLLDRFFWQHFLLEKSLERLGCDILLCPSGIYTGKYKKFVPICQNMLPFSPREMARFGLSLDYIRYKLLRIMQVYSFQRAAGVIFLSKHALRTVTEYCTKGIKIHKIIRHGVSERFRKSQFDIKTHDKEKYNKDKKSFEILYVSTINFYKHQSSVIEAVSNLRTSLDIDIHLHFVGSSHRRVKREFESNMRKYDPDGVWIKYSDKVSYDQIHKYYLHADIGVFASSCENLPIIALEYMASGLPLACSNFPPMPEILGKHAVYFDPENVQDIEDALQSLCASQENRIRLRNMAMKAANDFTWDATLSETISFLAHLQSNSLENK